MSSVLRFDKWENSLGQVYNNVVQVVSSTTTTVLSGTLGSSSNPTSTDGTLFHSFTFTPKFSNSKLLLQSTNILIGEYSNTGDEFYTAAFYDTTRIAMVAATTPWSSSRDSLNFGYYSYNNMFDSWGTSQKTISIRVGAGANNGGTMFVNTNYQYDQFGPSNHVVSFTLMEITQ